MPHLASQEDVKRFLRNELSLRYPTEVERLVELINGEDPAYIRNAIGGGLDDVDDLLAVARRVRVYISIGSGRQRPRVPRKPRGSESIPALLDSDRDQPIASAQRIALARDAAKRWPVTEFRRVILSGTLTPEDALRFVTSPAAATLPAEAFGARGIPGHHSSQVVAQEDTPDGQQMFTLLVDPPGAPVWVKHGHDDWTGHSEVALPDGQVSRTLLWSDSPLDHLRLAAEWLAERYPWWEDEAAWFVLTDVPPAVRPLRIGLRVIEDDPGDRASYRRGVITLTVDAWVSPQSVWKAYRDAQRQLLGGRNNRAPEHQSLDAFQAVEDWIREHGEAPEFRTLGEGWGYNNPDEFGETYQRTRRWLMTPTLSLPTDGDE